MDSYWYWTRLFFVFNGRRSSASWEGADWEKFERWMLSKRYSFSSRKQARCALNFNFKHVLRRDVGKLDLPNIPTPEKPLKIVPTREEIGRIFSGLVGMNRMKALLLYGSGPRIEEACRIRVHDVDLESARLRIWDGKGGKNRVTVLPVFALPMLRKMIAWRAALHEWDAAAGAGYVELPGRLAAKYRGANRELGWQWLFCSSVRRGTHRWYAPQDDFSRALRKAKIAAGIIKRITPHTLRHAFATHLQKAGATVETIRQLLGHARFETTLTYLHAEASEAFSPLDVPAAALQSPYAIERREALVLPSSEWIANVR